MQFITNQPSSKTVSTVISYYQILLPRKYIISGNSHFKCLRVFGEIPFAVVCGAAVCRNRTLAIMFVLLLSYVVFFKYGLNCSTNTDERYQLIITIATFTVFFTRTLCIGNS